jgi:hypothetical protein
MESELEMRFGSSWGPSRRIIQERCREQMRSCQLIYLLKLKEMPPEDHV